MKKILVTGVGGPAGRNVSAMLLERGYTLVTTDMLALNNENGAFYQVPAAGAPDFLQSIYSIAKNEKVDLIIPTVSEELPVIASGWQWQDEIPVLVSSGQAVQIANDKYLTACALSNHQVETPKFMLPSEAVSIEEVRHRIGWPCISKPRVGRGGREVTLRYEQDLPAIQALGDKYILQEFAAGIDYAPNVFNSPKNEGLVVTLEKTELKEGLVGNAKSVKRVTAPDVAQTALEAVRAVGLVGPLDVDIRKRADGTPVVLEINARFGANIRFAPEIMDTALKVYL
jgi:carbamoylphosphate synthase large subunit